MNEDQYRLTRKKLTRIGKGGPNTATVFVTGDVFVPTDSELRDFGDRLEKVIVEAPLLTQPSQPVPSQELPQEVEVAVQEKTPDPVAAASASLFKERISSMSASAVKAEVEAKKYDPQSVLKAEKTGQKRVTLIRWLEGVIQKLEE